MNVRQKSFVFLLLYALSFPTAASAASTGAEAAEIRTREVVVSATRTEKVLRDVPASVEIVTEKQLRERPVVTISDALRDIPGVQVLDNSMAGIQRVSIRGEAGMRVLVLVDGIKTTDQKSMDGAAIMMDPNFIERIEVIKGPSSVLYGSEAIGGVINVITKKGGTRPIQGTLMTGFDSSVDGWAPKGSVYGKVGGFGYRITGTYLDANNRNGADGKIGDTAFTNRYTSAYLDHQWDNATLAAGYEFYKNSSKLPGSHEDGQDIAMGLPRWQREKYYVSGELRELSDYLSKLKATVYRQQVLKNFWNSVDVDTLISMGPVSSRRIQVNTNPTTDGNITTYGGTAQSEWTLGEDNYLIAGIDVSRDNLKSNDRNTTTVTTTVTTPLGPTTSVSTSGYTDDLRANQKNFAAFIQDEWTFFPGWTVTAGLRQTWIQSELTDSSRYGERSSHDSHLVGSAGIVYSGFEDWRFRLQWGQGYRYPNLQQLYMGTSHGSSGTTYGNPNLEPEKSNSFEAGARYNTKEWMADFAVYHTRAKNYITSQKINSTDSMFKNLDSAWTTGVEARLEYTFSEWGITPYVAGAYMYRRVEQDNGRTAMTGDPRWTGSAGVRFEKELMPELNLTADFYSRFASSAKELTSEGAYYEYSGWSTLNFNIGARYGEERSVFANIAFNNLTNREYRTARGYLDDPGFNVVAQLGVEF